jgi:hypothetical protein
MYTSASKLGRVRRPRNRVNPIHSGEARLVDAAKNTLALESRFDLTYNAAHALSLAALRRLGYRSENRYMVFQTVPHTLGVATPVWRMLAKCHGLRNQAEYEGVIDLDERLVTDLVEAGGAVRDAVRRLPPTPVVDPVQCRPTPARRDSRASLSRR